MKILIVSDSHGQSEILHLLRERHAHEVEAMIHCGDSELSPTDSALNGFYTVKGNCDINGTFPNDFVKKIGPYTFFVTHGHLYNVKMTLMNLLYKAEETGANIVCFGHSHTAGSELIDGTLFVNPGSIHMPRGRKEKTYVILEVEGEQVQVHFYDAEGSRIISLSNSYQIPINPV
ncbi:metallophosphoesterase family protein [Peribacillus tepidiphilus]|uniref:metallophosphoesterase family protein n=1 Tax=Peribacillus tepidiphilus TaxID=2652445 RepID=UPI0012924525|nr:metallophosphoesterase [Peribacillus tepidiphilus]